MATITIVAAHPKYPAFTPGHGYEVDSATYAALTTGGFAVAGLPPTFSPSGPTSDGRDDDVLRTVGGVLDAVSMDALANSGVGLSFYTPSGASAFEKLLSQNGAVFNGTADDAAHIQESVDAVSADGKIKNLYFPEVEKVKINSGLMFTAPQVSFDLKGMTIDASGVTVPGGESETFAIKLTGTGASPNNRYSNTCPIKRFTLKGPNDESKAVDGVLITGSISQVPGHFALEDVFVEKFRDNLSLGTNFYISQFRNMHARNAWRSNVNFWGDSNAGESFSWYGGSLSDATNIAGTALGLWMQASAAEGALNFFGTSFSYNNMAFDVGGSKFHASGCFFESKSNNVMGRASYTSGRPGTVVYLDNPKIVHGPLSGSTEDAGGRPTMFEWVSGGRGTIMINGGGYNGYDRNKTELIKVTSGTPFVRVRGLNGESTANSATLGTKLGRISGYLSAIRNGDFGLGTTGYWTTAAVANTVVTVDAANPNSATGALGGANALKVVGSASAGSGTVVSQKVQCLPGEKVRVRAFATVTAYTSGTLFLRARFFSDNDTLIATSGSDIASIGAVRGWLMYGDDFAVPSGAKYCTVDAYSFSFVGTAYATDFEAWQI